MSDYAFRIVNVFAEQRLGGNPLAVFENGVDLSSETMQALALQFNLSETTFILPSTVASAHVRIFTPTFEMPFAGHPTLGTAHVARSAVILPGCGIALPPWHGNARRRHQPIDGVRLGDGRFRSCALPVFLFEARRRRGRPRHRLGVRQPGRLAACDVCEAPTGVFTEPR